MQLVKCNLKDKIGGCQTWTAFKVELFAWNYFLSISGRRILNASGIVLLLVHKGFQAFVFKFCSSYQVTNEPFVDWPNRQDGANVGAYWHRRGLAVSDANRTLCPIVGSLEILCARERGMNGNTDIRYRWAGVGHRNTEKGSTAKSIKRLPLLAIY